MCHSTQRVTSKVPKLLKEEKDNEEVQVETNNATDMRKIPQKFQDIRTSTNFYKTKLKSIVQGIFTPMEMLLGWSNKSVHRKKCFKPEFFKKIARLLSYSEEVFGDRNYGRDTQLLIFQD